MSEKINRTERINKTMHELTEAYRGMYPSELNEDRDWEERNFKPLKTSKQRASVSRAIHKMNTSAGPYTDKSARQSDTAHHARRVYDAEQVRPGNKISQFQRNDVEYALDYLIDEGYATDYVSALNILEAMSDEWLDDISEKFVIAMSKPGRRRDYRERPTDEGFIRLKKRPESSKFWDSQTGPGKDQSPKARRRREERSAARGGFR